MKSGFCSFRLRSPSFSHCIHWTRVLPDLALIQTSFRNFDEFTVSMDFHREKFSRRDLRRIFFGSISYPPIDVDRCRSRRNGRKYIDTQKKLKTPRLIFSFAADRGKLILFSSKTIADRAIFLKAMRSSIKSSSTSEEENTTRC